METPRNKDLLSEMNKDHMSPQKLRRNKALLIDMNKAHMSPQKWRNMHRAFTGVYHILCMYIMASTFIYLWDSQSMQINISPTLLFCWIAVSNFNVCSGYDAQQYHKLKMFLHQADGVSKIVY